MYTQARIKGAYVMTSERDLLSRIQTSMSTFSKGHKAIGRYIIENYDKAAFMTACKLGKAVGVSESTVVRFAMELGYDGYPRLQKALQELIRAKLTSVQRIQASSGRINEDEVLKNVILSDIDKLRLTLDDIKKEEFQKIVTAIMEANKIYILGVRSSAALASFMGFYFNLIFENMRLVHTTSASEMFEQVLRVKKGDVVIGISFPRYSKRTVRALQFAKDRGATVVAITDSYTSPLTDCSDYNLIAKSDMVSFVDSLVAPLSVINALIVAIGLRKKEEVFSVFEELENIWDEYDVYEKNDEV